jgi:hypothetical protein
VCIRIRSKSYTSDFSVTKELSIANLLLCDKFHNIYSNAFDNMIISLPRQVIFASWQCTILHIFFQKIVPVLEHHPTNQISFQATFKAHKIEN